MYTIKQFAKEHKFLSYSVILSFILCFPVFIIYFSSNRDISSFLLLTPFLLILLNNIIAYFTFPKFPKVTKWISTLINTLMLLIITLGIAIILIIIFAIFRPDKDYTDFKQYEEAKKSIYAQYRIQHFPQTLPEDATNIHFYKNHHPWFGSEGILLEFNTNKNFIENELKKYKFINIDTINADRYRYNYMLAGSQDFNIEGFTFYVINDRDNENPPEHHFPYHYGIGVSPDFTQIIYYYDCPD